MNNLDLIKQYLDNWVNSRISTTNVYRNVIMVGQDDDDMLEP
jgi:hypothetical protein